MKTIKKYWASVVMAALSVFFGALTVMMGISYYETIVEEINEPTFSLTWSEGGVYATMMLMWVAGVIDAIVAALVAVKEYKHISKWEK